MYLGHAKLFSCFWSYKSLKNDQATRLFFFFSFFFFFFSETKVERKWCTNSIMHLEGEVWGQDYKMQNTNRLVYPGSQNIEAWMVKPLSTGCVNTEVAC